MLFAEVLFFFAHSKLVFGNYFCFVQTNLQLLAACYLQSNQAYSAYHILKGTFLRIASY